MSEPTRGHLAVTLPCDKVPGLVMLCEHMTPTTIPPFAPTCEGCKADGSRTVPTDVPAHSDEWIRETVALAGRPDDSTGYREGRNAAVAEILAALDADTGENDE